MPFTTYLLSFTWKGRSVRKAQLRTDKDIRNGYQAIAEILRKQEPELIERLENEIVGRDGASRRWERICTSAGVTGPLHVAGGDITFQEL